MSHRSVRALCEGAILVAAAQLLSYLRLWRMPWGGSVVLAMVPIVLYAIRWGFARGLFAGFVFGILQFTLDGGFAIGWQSILGDYLVAFTVLGCAGFFARKKYGVFAGSVVAGVARFIVHWVVGATVWAAYMPDVYLGINMSSPWFYSLLYNACYMLPNIVITVVVFAILYAIKPVRKYLYAGDLA